MSRFTGELKVTFSPARERWARLEEDLLWEISEKGSGIYIVVPKGFESDGVTVPRAFWSILPPWGHPATRAALLHDFLLVSGYERRFAAREFKLAMIATGVNKAFAQTVYLAVRAYDLFRGATLRFRSSLV